MFFFQREPNILQRFVHVLRTIFNPSLLNWSLLILTVAQYVLCSIYALDIMMYRVPVVYMTCVYLVHGWYTLPFWVTFIALTDPDPFLLLQEPNTTFSLKPGVVWWFTTLRRLDQVNPSFEDHPSPVVGMVWGYTDVPKKIRLQMFSIFSPVQIRKGRDPRSFGPILLNPFKLCAMSLLSSVIMIPNYWKVVYSM